MTPKEKAVELYEKYYYTIPSNYDGCFSYGLSIKRALIFVNQILKEYWLHDIDRKKYWEEVKQELYNL